ncbi:unnamed protein product [Linum tenue]|uniref:Aminotransferase-like plant mobile domain-containing protein n=1 Tax=Linum tenue TaxID=586396 RepID=A0AAV0NCZ9_9ROSI|nr:unnamed protein product [Linum tenue]
MTDKRTKLKVLVGPILPALHPDHDHPQTAGGSGNPRQQPDGHSSTAPADFVVIRRGPNGRFTSAHHADAEAIRSKKKKKLMTRDGTTRDETWVLTEPAPGGPEDPTLIPSFKGHAAFRLWTQPELARGSIGYYSHDRGLDFLTRYEFASSGSLELVQGTGLFHLRECVTRNLNRPLLTAFVERWQPDTNTFHMPFGEMTILLHDVFHILRIPVDGELLSRGCDSFPGFLGLTMDDLVRLVDIDRGKSVTTHVHQHRNKDSEVKHYLLCLLGSILFMDKTRDRGVLDTINLFVRDHERVKRYAWGVGTLAYLYRQLGVASRAMSYAVGGCLTLLQAWIYEYFPSLRPTGYEPPTLKDGEALAFRWKGARLEGGHRPDAKQLQYYRLMLDELTAEDVTWLPYGQNPGQVVPLSLYHGVIRFGDVGEMYDPGRCLRQFGYRQVVPIHPIKPAYAFRPASGMGYDVRFDSVLDNFWSYRHRHTLQLDTISAPAQPLWEADEDYSDWYFKHSHPFIVKPHGMEDPRGNAIAYKLSIQIIENLRPMLTADDDTLPPQFLEMIRRARGLLVEYDRRKARGPPTHSSLV